MNYETVKTKNEVTLVEREKEISALKEQVAAMGLKEQALGDKAEKLEMKHREEH